MCQLFGASLSRKTELSGYLNEFFSHSVKHPHGWGMALFDGETVNLEKEPLPAWQSHYLKSRLKNGLEAQNMIAHIRQASQGGLDYLNCHPFVGKDRTGRVWTLAHNGTVASPSVLDRFAGEQKGSTDSERILYYLLHRLDGYQEGAGARTAEDRRTVAEAVLAELADGNKLNVLLYDGTCLYVHTNKAGTLYRKKTETGALFATVPLDGGDWEPLPLTRMLVYRDGEEVYAGPPHGHEYTKADPTPLHLEFSCL